MGERERELKGKRHGWKREKDRRDGREKDKRIEEWGKRDRDG